MWKIIGAILMVASAALIVSPAFVRTAQVGASRKPSRKK